MTNPLSSISPSTAAMKSLMSPKSSESTATGGVSFESLLAGALENTAALDQSAQQAIQSHLLGGDVSSVEVFSGMKKADLALRMMLQIRNKLLEGFNEIKQMQM